MAAMSATAAMPVSRTAQFAPKRATKARVVRRGVIAAAGKRGTQPNTRGKKPIKMRLWLRPRSRSYPLEPRPAHPPRPAPFAPPDLTSR